MSLAQTTHYSGDTSLFESTSNDIVDKDYSIHLSSSVADNSKIGVIPSFGTIVVFLSEYFVHEVLPAKLYQTD